VKKNLFVIINLMFLIVFYSTTSQAHDWDHHGHRGHHGRGWERHGDQGYYPQPRYNNYNPEPRYYGPQHRDYGYDRRSTQGLAGGVIGSIFGYQLGSGDPIAAGLGAAAGSFLGNGFGARY